MFPDPQSVTINAVPQSLPRVDVGSLRSIYRKDDGTYKLTISHTEGKRYRHSVRLDAEKIALDALTAENMEVSMSAYLVIDMPNAGYTATEAKDIALGLTTWLSSANLLKVIGLES